MESSNSSAETKHRAETLAHQIGRYETVSWATDQESGICTSCSTIIIENNSELCSRLPGANIPAIYSCGFHTSGCLLGIITLSVYSIFAVINVVAIFLRKYCFGWQLIFFCFVFFMLVAIIIIIIIYVVIVLFWFLFILLFSRHLSVSIDGVVSGCLDVFQLATSLVPKFRVHGGTNSENLALQNVQVWSYNNNNNKPPTH